MSAACSAALSVPLPPGVAGPGQGAARAPGAGRLAPAQEPLLPGLAATLDAEERAAFEALRAAWHARATPADAAERAVVDVIAACAFRLMRLDAVEAVLTRRLIEGGSTAGLPSLATLVRARADLARDQARAEADLMHLRDIRPKPPAWPGLNPARLRWLAQRLEEGRIAPWAPAGDAAPEPSAEAASGPSPGARPTSPAAAPVAAEPAAAPAAPALAAEHAAPEPAAEHAAPALAAAPASPSAFTREPRGRMGGRMGARNAKGRPRGRPGAIPPRGVEDQARSR